MLEVLKMPYEFTEWEANSSSNAVRGGMLG